MSGTDSSAGDSAGVIAPPPLIYAGGLGLGLLLGALVRPPALPAAWAWPLGVLAALAGVILAGWFVATFRRAGTQVDPRSSVTALVTTGPYRITRNPGYLGMALVYAGIALVTGATWAFLTLIPTLAVIDRGVIAREERYLQRKFGDQYGRFKARTRRWL